MARSKEQEMDAYRLDKMVMWDLREKMMNDMSANVMVNFVDQPVVPIKRCQSSTQITPFLLVQEEMLISNQARIVKQLHSPLGFF
jgi:hypothetical protein